MAKELTPTEMRKINWWRSRTPILPPEWQGFPGQREGYARDVEAMFEKMDETFIRAFYVQCFGKKAPETHTFEDVKNALRVLNDARRGADERIKAAQGGNEG